MRRKWIVVLIVALLLVPMNAKATDGVAVWGLAGDGADHSANFLAGLIRDLGKGEAEVGVSIAWFTAEPEWGPEPDAVGPYFAYHLEELMQISDVSPDGLWEGMLHALVGKPYLRIEGLFPCDGPDRTIGINYMAGTLVALNEDFTWAIALEYKAGQAVASAGDHSDSMFLVGARIKF